MKWVNYYWIYKIWIITNNEYYKYRLLDILFVKLHETMNIKLWIEILESEWTLHRYIEKEELWYP